MKYNTTVRCAHAQSRATKGGGPGPGAGGRFFIFRFFDFVDFSIFDFSIYRFSDLFDLSFFEIANLRTYAFVIVLEGCAGTKHISDTCHPGQTQFALK